MRLRVGQEVAVSCRVPAASASGRIYEQVTLLRPRETIGFWETCPIPSSGLYGGHAPQRAAPAAQPVKVRKGS